MLTLCILALTANTADAQSYSPLYATSSSRTLYAVCYDAFGNFIPNCPVSLSTNYYADTNAHTASQHSGSSPLSTVSPSSGSTGTSGLPFTHTTTVVGHAEYIRVCAPAICQDYNYAVGYTIYYVNEHGIWTLVGATAQHGNSTAFNHWMTTNAANGIYATTLDYQANVNPALVSVNDMSLPFGGKFDINGTWSGDHASHYFGTDVDINGTLDSFMSYCTAHGANFTVKHAPGNLHCRWPN
jgi:hypothetical protein